MAEMTKDVLRKICKENSLYTTPSINDKIYLHYKGFSTIQNLDEYIGLKALWLEGNGLTTISGLENQKLLKTLYLHENLIEVIQGLENQTELDTLNLSKNYIKKIENISHMKVLTHLNLAHNLVSSLEGIEHVLHVPSLQTIDLQHNKLEDPSIVEVFAQLPDLRVLYLMGNPVVKHIRNYRKNVVYKCKMLKYLDDRPVFDDERRRTEAWGRVLACGGTFDDAQEAERVEIQQIKKEKEETDEKNFRAFELLMKEGQEIRRMKEAEKAALNFNLIERNENLPEHNPFSGEEIIEISESECLKTARDNRWGIVGIDSSNVPLESSTSSFPEENVCLPENGVKSTPSKFISLLTEAMEDKKTKVSSANLSMNDVHVNDNSDLNIEKYDELD